MSTPVKPRKITEDILLNLKTRRCRVTCSEATAQTDISWDDYLELCFEKELIYYVDLESFRLEMQLDQHNRVHEKGRRVRISVPGEFRQRLRMDNRFCRSCREIRR